MKNIRWCDLLVGDLIYERSDQELWLLIDFDKTTNKWMKLSNITKGRIITTTRSEYKLKNDIGWLLLRTEDNWSNDNLSIK